VGVATTMCVTGIAFHLRRSMTAKLVCSRHGSRIAPIDHLGNLNQVGGRSNGSGT